MRKDAHIQSTFAAHVLLGGNTARFNGLGFDPARLQRLQAKVAEHDLVAARCITF